MIQEPMPQVYLGKADSGSAVISDCGKYRYSLTRRLVSKAVEVPKDKRVCFVMLNPSTADAWKDDPTIRKCIGFSERWGYYQLDVVNLFAYRATDPRELARVGYPVGKDNAMALDNGFSFSSLVVVAWGEAIGVPRRMLSMATEAAAGMMKIWGVQPRCLGKTKSGQPRHPLYVSYTTELEDWNAP